MLTLTQRLDRHAIVPKNSFSLSLNAEERTRSRHRFETVDGEVFIVRLPRGTILQDGDFLQAETGEIVRIIAKPEPVLTVRANTPTTLLKAAYHLGNRHVALEVRATYLRLSPDSVLRSLLEQLDSDLKIEEEIAPFQPEIGAYRHSH
ncbi:MAG: urease accessory protein UreE [Cyanobacteria bacterium SBLK]|nr:urease accessory protein UreE [Cyanobacteria bacterium SBLK]